MNSVAPWRTRISRVGFVVRGAQEPMVGAEPLVVTSSTAASIAWLASASASVLRSRGIHSKSTGANCRTSVAAWAASGRRPGA